MPVPVKNKKKVYHAQHTAHRVVSHGASGNGFLTRVALHCDFRDRFWFSSLVPTSPAFPKVLWVARDPWNKLIFC